MLNFTDIYYPRSPTHIEISTYTDHYGLLICWFYYPCFPIPNFVINTDIFYSKPPPVDLLFKNVTKKTKKAKIL
jgi:hypothetical protein